MALPVALIRLVVLSAVALFALIALGVAAAFTSTTSSNLFINHTFEFASLGIATAVFTLVTVPPMIALEMLRPGGPTSMIIVEISWLAFLSILWLSTGADTASFNAAFLGCGNSKVDKEIHQAEDQVGIPHGICSELSALEAFAFLNWIILMGYIGMLLVMSIMAASRKHTNVWTSSVANAPFSEPAKNSSVPMSYNAGTGGQPGGYSTSGSVQAGTVHV
ncbi:hypothetical protein MSAN_01618000 [Mycena sanguinolenta]|uniref:MARVEL domain-containing protein n=1 Tax=Mycena sanguinolenta TaxID=230812 RepID=A0A8H6XYD3_9AGAR|nr:hypothetical protein MSAN_01618000 [Mycena sanguinolenta]